MHIKLYTLSNWIPGKLSKRQHTVCYSLVGEESWLLALVKSSQVCNVAFQVDTFVDIIQHHASCDRHSAILFFILYSCKSPSTKVCCNACC